MMERVKVFDSFYKQTGEEDIDVVHQNGLWHETFHCWICSKKDNDIFVYLQKRAATKKSHPSKIDVVVAGHLRNHENKYNGVREIKEEIGIDVKPEELLYLGKRIEVFESNNYFDHEFQHVFLLNKTLFGTSLTIQKEEVDCLVKARLNELIDLFEDKIDSLLVPVLFTNNDLGEILVKKEDFVYRQDNYYLKALVLIDRFFKNEQHLYI